MTASNPLFDGDPDRLTPTPRLDDLLLQAVEPDAAVNDLTNELVLAYEDAAFGDDRDDIFETL